MTRRNQDIDVAVDATSGAADLAVAADAAMTVSVTAICPISGQPHCFGS